MVIEINEDLIIEEDTHQWVPEGTYAKCSNCGGGVDLYVSKHYKYCPFCGKKMFEKI